MSNTQSSYPFVVMVTDTIGSQSWQASGVLISPDEVLTASHVVYSQGIGTATNIVVTPAYQNGSSPYGSTTGTSVHYFPIDDANDGITNQQSQYDFAVIHLAKPFTSVGFMSLEANFAGGPVDITGYPAAANGFQVDSSQTVSRDPYYTLLDGTALGRGSSGGPVWVETAQGPAVVGVVSTESATGSVGYNAAITTSVYNQIETWISQDDRGSLPPLADRYGADFNGDGVSDILFQNSSSGLLLDWQMLNGSSGAAVSIGAASPGWQEVGTGDFNGDGTSDVLFRNSNSGQILDWQMSNSSPSASVTLGTASSDWQVLGTGDFNGDGTSDILFGNSNSGLIADWQISNNAVVSSAVLGDATYGWKFLGTGDFNGDGTSDILFSNTQSGQVLDWQMANGAVAKSVLLGTASPGWTFAATGDFNGDGTSDILFQNSSSNGLAEWQMSNGTVAKAISVGTAAAGSQVVGTGDYNRDGTTDILFQNASSGALSDWQMSGGAVSQTIAIGTATTGWKILPA